MSSALTAPAPGLRASGDSQVACIADQEEVLENSFAMPDGALAEVSAALGALAEPTRGAERSAGNWNVPCGAVLKA